MQVKGLREIVLIHDLKKQGLSISAIARKVGCDRKTVRRHLDRGLEAPVYEPEVLRRFDVPLKIRLSRLHEVIQAAMGWSDTHLYEFRAGGVGWGVADPDGFHDGPLPASKTSLLDVIEDVGTKTIHYIYDFGNSWHHVIRVEKIGDAIPGADWFCPRFTGHSGGCGLGCDELAGRAHFQP